MAGSCAAGTRSPYRLVLVDDHTLFREGLRRLLDRSKTVDVVGEAADGEEALEVCQRTNPDLVAVDLVMPGLGGLEAIRRLRKLCPEMRIMVLTMQQDSAHVQHARRAGAHGYLTKDTDPETLCRTLQKVAAGDNVFPRVTETAAPGGRLSPRETEVLRMVSEGLSNRQIGERLDISPRTVEAHRAVVCQKLGLKKLAELVRYAVRQGLVTP